jgi:acetyl esterase/lipase
MSREILDLPPPPADLRLSYGPLPLQFGDLRLPTTPPPHPLAILVHGGFWRARYDLAHLGHLAAALTAEGIATWSLEYRRIGDEGGGWPGTFLDVAAGADHARTLAPIYGLDLGRVITLGHSAGGHLALWLAGRSRIASAGPLHGATPLSLRGAMSLGGVVDLAEAWTMALDDRVVEQLMGGTPDTVPERYVAGNPYALLPLGVPHILMHGTEDEPVPYAIGERYAGQAAAMGDQVEMITLQGMGHFEPIDPRSAAWPLVRQAAWTLRQPGTAVPW